MDFKMAQCELCRESISVEANLQAFQIRDKAIELFSLKGRQPWAGVRCICLNCLKQLSLSAAPISYRRLVQGDPCECGSKIGKDGYCRDCGFGYQE